jgi:putative SOS response-associated peptidase YedK
MCGRYSLITDPSTIISEFAIQSIQLFTPRYNIAPANFIPVILNYGHVDFAMWGFKPKWAENRLDIKPFINARIEDIITKVTFKHAINNNRCLILADGYYEWKLIKRTKQPFYISLLNHKIFAFAGIVDKDTNTCAILTKSADSKLSSIHPRMPVILSNQIEYMDWLNKKSKLDHLLETVITKPSKNYRVTAVTATVNNVRNDHLGCIQDLQ